MRPVALTVGARELALALDLGALDELASVEPDFMKVAVGFTAGREMNWRHARTILSAAFRPHGEPLSRFVAERGLVEAHGLAARLFLAAMNPEDEAAGNGAAGGEPEAPSGASPSPATSAPAP